MKRTLTLRGIALADAVRMFEARGVPSGWLPVVMATREPKHKSPSTNRRNRERRERHQAQMEGRVDG